MNNHINIFFPKTKERVENFYFEKVNIYQDFKIFFQDFNEELKVENKQTNK